MTFFANKVRVAGDIEVGTGNDHENHELVIRGPSYPNNEKSYQDISYKFAGGSAKIRGYRGGAWETYLQFLTNDSEPLEDKPQVRMHIHHNGNVGIGTSDPKAKLQVSGGAIMPAAGDNESAGILFPKDPGAGGGDAAWIRYYVRSGENTTLEIGTSDNTEDHIALMSSGGVGIGTNEPKAKLHIAGNSSREVVLRSDGFISLQGAANPESSTGFSNQITPKNLIKAWGVVNTNNGNPIIVDGFNINSVTIDGSHEATITLTTGNAEVICMAGNSPSDESFIRLRYASSKVIKAKGYHRTGGVQGWATSSFYFSFIVIGAL